MKVLIIDVAMMNMKYVNTLMPSSTVALISGYHKGIGDSVSLLLPTSPFQPEVYDKCYIVNDSRHEYEIKEEWGDYPKAELVGKFYIKLDLAEEKAEWSDYPPDFEIYHPFIDYWRHKFPSYNLSRLEIFFQVPFKMFRGGDVFYPTFDDVVIIDMDIDTWDPDFQHLSSLERRGIRFNNPLPIKHNIRGALELFDLRTIQRKSFWAEFEITAEDDLDYIYQMAKTCGELNPGRMFRIKMWAEAPNDQEWQKLIIKVYKALEYFRLLSTKRLYFEPLNYKNGETNFPHVIQFTKRWCAKQGFKKNSALDYIIYDGLQTIDNMVKFLTEPEEFSKTNVKAKNLLNFIKNYPNLAYVLSQSYGIGAW